MRRAAGHLIGSPVRFQLQGIVASTNGEFPLQAFLLAVFAFVVETGVAAAGAFALKKSMRRRPQNRRRALTAMV
jgi:hypothetical protein